MQPRLSFFSVDDIADMAPQLDFEGLQLLMAEIVEDSELYDEKEVAAIEYIFNRCVDDLKHKVR